MNLPAVISQYGILIMGQSHHQSLWQVGNVRIISYVTRIKITSMWKQSNHAQQPHIAVPTTKSSKSWGYQQFLPTESTIRGGLNYSLTPTITRAFHWPICLSATLLVDATKQSIAITKSMTLHPSSVPNQQSQYLGPEHQTGKIKILSWLQWSDELNLTHQANFLLYDHT